MAIKSFVGDIPNLGNQLYNRDIPILVQPSLPKPNSKQIFHRCQITIDATTRDYQVISKLTTNRIFFIGIRAVQGTATANTVVIWDSISGTSPSNPTPGSINYDGNSRIDYALPTTVGSVTPIIFPYPIEITQGIRVECGAATVSGIIEVWYIEETI